MNPATLELRRMADMLHALFPQAQSVQLSAHAGQVDVDIHRIGDASATEMLERLGLNTTTTQGKGVDYVEAWCNGVRFCVYVRQEVAAGMTLTDPANSRVEGKP